MQRAGLLLNNWHRGVIFRATYCASPHRNGRLTRARVKLKVAFVVAIGNLWDHLTEETGFSVTPVCVFTDSVGRLWSGDDRKRRHLPHNLWLLRGVWRRR